MCNNLKKIEATKATVYKVVAMKPKGKRFYSVAMGFVYPKIKGNIPKIKVQHRITKNFSEGILSRLDIYSGYNPDMIGRTAGFLILLNAETTARYLQNNISKEKYIILVKTAILTKELMSGTYDKKSVIAGKHIEWVN
jgi:hypothetical protein